MTTRVRRSKGAGGITQRGSHVWEVSYIDPDGHRRHMTVRGTKLHAQRELSRVSGDVARGQTPPTASQRHYTLGEALAAVLTDYQLNERRSVSGMKRRVRLHLLPFFGSQMRVRALTAERIAAYQVARRAPVQVAVTPSVDPLWQDDPTVPVHAIPNVPHPASPASVNRETAILKRCLTLAKRRGYVDSIPYIQSLEEAAPREGFLSDAEYVAIRAELTHKPHAQGVLDFGFLTGWRVSEILGLTWSEVDRTRRTVLLPASRNKGGVARPLHVFDQLWAVLETWHDRRLVGVPFVFHHAGGKPVKSIRAAILKAAERAGVRGFMFHNLRRTAARNLVNRVGLSTKLARLITGHRTDSVFDRYNIVADDDLRTAALAISASGVGTSKAS